MEANEIKKALECFGSKLKSKTSSCVGCYFETKGLCEEKSYEALDEAVNFYCSFTKSKVQNCPIDDEVAKAKTDTVKKYRECLYRELASLGAKDKFNKEFFLTKADQIAKEMLEGEK